MKYSVGDMFMDHFGQTMVIVKVIMSIPSGSWTGDKFPYYLTKIEGRNSNLRWYDKDFDGYKNITCPVLKELNS